MGAICTRPEAIAVALPVSTEYKVLWTRSGGRGGVRGGFANAGVLLICIFRPLSCSARIEPTFLARKYCF